jgi:hypothetical protein
MPVDTACVDLVDFLDGYTCTGTLVLDDDIALSTKAWSTTSLLPLWVPGDTRGSNLTLPQVFGTVPYPKRIHEAEHALPMLITGCWDADGDAYEDDLIGLQANLTYLANALFNPGDPTTGCFDAELTMPDTSTRDGLLQVRAFTLGEPDRRSNGVYWRATLSVVLPQGWLVEAGS